MLRILILSLFLVGCTFSASRDLEKERADAVKHAKLQAENFCTCLKDTVRLIQIKSDSWDVYCEGGTNSLNTNYGAEYSCK